MTLTLVPGPYLRAGQAVATVTIANDPLGGIAVVDADAPGPVEDGRTWATAYRTLTAALAQVSSIDTFWVAEGTYTPGAAAGDTFVLGTDTVLYGGFAGTETSVNQRNWTAHETVLSGDLGGGVFAQHVLTKATGASAVLDGFTVRDGRGGAADGGGVYHAAGSLTRGQLPAQRQQRQQWWRVVCGGGDDDDGRGLRFVRQCGRCRWRGRAFSGATGLCARGFRRKCGGRSRRRVVRRRRRWLEHASQLRLRGQQRGAGSGGGGGALYFSGDAARGIPQRHILQEPGQLGRRGDPDAGRGS